MEYDNNLKSSFCSWFVGSLVHLSSHDDNNNNGPNKIELLERRRNRFWPEEDEELAKQCNGEIAHSKMETVKRQDEDEDNRNSCTRGTVATSLCLGAFS